MNNELKVRVGTSEKKIFLQPGFYDFSIGISHIHKHKYSEIHIVAAGKTLFVVDNKTFELTKGDVFAIPANTYHACTFRSCDIIDTAFQIESPIEKISNIKFSPETLSDFFNEIKKCQMNNNYSKIAAYISLICSDFYPQEEASIYKMTDYAFIIYEFFSSKYCLNVCLSDLAAELHLSEKQTERLIKKYTGNTYKQEIVARRMNMANYLLNTKKMGLAEVAQYVGYSSYSGFWKAYKKYIQNEV